MYAVLNPIKWTPGINQPPSLPDVVVPVGFVTDLTSVPPVFFSYLRPDGPYAYAAIIHDWLYWEQTIARETADEILDLGMSDFKVDGAKRTIITTAVKTFGKGPWNQNRSDRAAGERRVLKVLPDDPTIPWSKWKLRPNVFGSL